jgi:3-methyladenine DNA glycosylase AlkD
MNISELRDHILQELKTMADPQFQAGMARYAIDNSRSLGIRAPILRAYAKPYRKNHELALALWDSDIHEAKHIAGYIADASQMTEAQMEKWVADCYSWDLVDNICGVFAQTPYALDKAKEWIQREEEYVKRAGFVTFVSLAVHDKKAPDELFLSFFPYIREGASDERNFVKKAVNWLLRQIGKRNIRLHPHALVLAEELAQSDIPSARWIGKDAVRELTNEKIIERLKRKAD